MQQRKNNDAAKSPKKGLQAGQPLPRAVRVSVAALCMLGLGLSMALRGKKHFSFESLPGFDALLGAGAVVGLVVCAMVLGRFLRRSEEYYDQ